MNIFKQEFSMKKKSILIWSISISAFIIFYMAFFPGISKESAGVQSLMDSLPTEMLQAVGLRKGLSIGELIGFFTITFTMAQLAMAIQSSNYGFSILSVEGRNQTGDFLMSKPVSRSKIYWSKFLASFIGLLITAATVSVASFIALETFSGGQSYQREYLLKLLATIPIFQTIFLSLGMLISVILKRIKSVLGFSMSLSVGLFVIDAVRSVVGSDFLGLLSPYYYFEAGNILKTGNYDLKLFAVAIAIIVVALPAGLFIYKRQDIDSV